MLMQRMFCAWVELRGPPLVLFLPVPLPPISLEGLVIAAAASSYSAVCRHQGLKTASVDDW